MGEKLPTVEMIIRQLDSDHVRILKSKGCGMWDPSELTMWTLENAPKVIKHYKTFLKGFQDANYIEFRNIYPEYFIDQPWEELYEDVYDKDGNPLPNRAEIMLAADAMIEAQFDENGDRTNYSDFVPDGHTSWTLINMKRAMAHSDVYCKGFKVAKGLEFERRWPDKFKCKIEEEMK